MTQPKNNDLRLAVLMDADNVPAKALVDAGGDDRPR